MAGHVTSPDSWIADRLRTPQQRFGRFASIVYNRGALDRKTKELIAIATASVGRCPHCTDGHLSGASEAGASEEEIAEALAVAWAAGGASQVAWLERVAGADLPADWPSSIPEADEAFAAFRAAVFEEGVLDRKAKELIAVTVCTMLRSAPAVRRHLAAAGEAGATADEIASALGVMWVIASGVEAVWAKDHFNRHLRATVDAPR